MTFLRSFLISLAVILLLTASFLAGYLLHSQQSTTANLPILSQAYDILIQNGYKDPPPVPALEYGMIKGMLQAYNDPYTLFVEPPQHKLDSNALEGKYGGIGVQLEKDQAGYWVMYPFSDSPASQAGLQEGDRLLSIEKLTVEPATSMDIVQAALRGPVGERVTLTVGRAPDFAPLSFTINRAEIALPSVTWHIDLTESRLGVIDVSLIAATTSDEIQRAVKELTDRGATHYVLDLRDNPGGLLTAGVDVARLFLKDGDVIQQQYRGRSVETYRVETPGLLADIPLAVLINQGSASAAEIVAGALQVQRRAPLIGQPSYGKDTIQLVFELQDKSSLHVTAAHWWIPGLNPPVGEAGGLKPDILVPAPSDTTTGDPMMQAAIQYLFGIK